LKANHNGFRRAICRSAVVIKDRQNCPDIHQEKVEGSEIPANEVAPGQIIPIVIGIIKDRQNCPDIHQEKVEGSEIPANEVAPGQIIPIVIGIIKDRQN
jgi:hypothetical protein